ncbi:uncharacterized protein DUF4175 [Tenacibaculum lutimaris]|uniref:Uncharacterized protein DUF4175 n=1 Tax=Tenacibaculum lutimaris TaxID=285258 RepID=A0A420E558_9FLAO|nr:DUF4175 family protein [Tenacibaculum lutimaris]RKF05139.1 uncharacterized protein DUF4175 [Tenacibaculum lutimaris]
MGEFTKIQQKLQQFSRKYYTNELIKGSILFVSLGLLYLFFTLFIEYFLWLQPTARTLLFWLFIVVELFLLFRFICFPIFKIIGLQKGISFEEASKIIGNHFPEVQDKLLNVLQLQQTNQQSDLLVASIEQKSKELQPISFNKAINFSSNKKYLKYVLIPVFIWVLSLLTGTSEKLSQSLNRVVNHSVDYNPPAPFYFNLTAKDLRVIKGKDITIYFQTTGEVIPNEAKVHFNNQQYFLENEGNGLFSYTFSEVQNPITFYASANGINSQEYKLTIINTPSIQNISLHLQYPSYIKKANETINNTGNLNVPQGTFITWNIKTSETDTVTFINKEKREIFTRKENEKFEFKKQLNESLHYQIATSNKNLKDYEQLQFSIDVIKDEYPTISVNSNIDSITRGNAQFAGQIADDYGFKKLEIVYYDKSNSQNIESKSITINKENIQTFYFEFPGDLNLKNGINYELYFQVYDNDIVNGSKNALSKKFSYRQKSEEEIEEELLLEQKNYIENINNSLDQQQKSKKELEKIQFDLQNKKNINWNDQKKIQNLVKRQEQYKEMMQRQTQKLQENFSEKKEENETLQEKKENLQKRIEELKKLEKQQKLLDELKKLADKLNKEELIKKTKELAEQNKQQERSLERILEMTKRFYVEQKMNQLANKLDELSKKQEKLSDKNTTKEEQKEINTEFQKAKKELNDLDKDNKNLKQPMEIPSMENLEKEVQEELNKADENLDNDQQQNAKKNQKKASEKMQQMSQKMQQAMQSMSAEMEEENMEGLRQILENLITFSFDQEALMDEFSSTNSSHPNFGKNLQKQHQLKTYFEHIDDSLFVLSMRIPSISSKVQDQLAQAHYNLDQSLENFADNYFQNGVSNQQYVMTSANTLADMLSNTLDAMQNPKPGNGKGKGKGKSFSLPDIIQQQNELMEKMKEGMQKQNQGKPKDDKEGQKEGEGEGEKNDDLDGELYQIYKEQSQLREQLENAIKEGNGDNKEAKKALKKMEELENQILEKGFTQESINRMQQLNYELLKLDKATFEQNREKQRKSNTNLQEFNNNNSKELKFKKLFYNQTEILNRQSLPLRQNYKKKVQEYFSLPKDKE